MIRKLLLTSFCLSSIFSSAQIHFQKTFGTAADEKAIRMIQTFDQGYAFFELRNYHPTIVRLDSLGNVLWTREYLSQVSGYAPLTFDQTADSGFIFINENLWVTKTDQYGNILWTHSYYVNNGNIQTIKSTFDGGYIVGGNSYWTGYSFFISKLDASGNIIWKTLLDPGTGNAIYFNGVIQVRDSGYVTLSRASGAALVLSKFSANGTYLWSKSIVVNGQNPTYYSSLIKGISGHLLLSFDNNNQSCFTELDSAANFIRANTYSDLNQWNIYMNQCADHGYIITSPGYMTAYSYDPSHFIIMKTDSLGAIRWTKWVGGHKNDIPVSIIQTKDGGIAVGGSTENFSHGNYDLYMIKTDTSGTIFCNDSTLYPTRTTNTGVVGNVIYASHAPGMSTTPQTFSDITQITSNYDACFCIPPTAYFTAAGLNGDVNDSSLWASHWHWYFGDGNEDSLMIHPYHYYTSTADSVYYVCLTVTNACGSSTYCDSVYYHFQPISTNDISKTNLQFEIYPNPSSGKFSVELKDRSHDPAKIEITNIIGEKILEERFLEENKTIDLSKEAKGIYFIRIRSGDKISSKKIVIE